MVTLSLVCEADTTLPDHPHYAIEHFGEQYGLSAITVTSMAQDRCGFLWIGTLTGLYRYDGFSVAHFRAEDGLPSNQVYQLLTSSHGDLFVRTRRGITRLDGQQFRSIAIPPESGGARDILESFAVDDAGSLFAATEHGLLRLDLSSGSWKAYGAPDGLPGAHVDAIVRGPDDTVWFAAGRRIGRFTRGSLRPEMLASPVLPAETVHWLIVDGEDRWRTKPGPPRSLDAADYRRFVPPQRRPMALGGPQQRTYRQRSFFCIPGQRRNDLDWARRRGSGSLARFDAMVRMGR